MVPAARGDGNRDRGDATSKEHVLSATVRGAGGCKALRMERRGIQTATPPWMLLAGKQLREGKHLPPLAPRTTILKKTAKGRPRMTRYKLVLHDTHNP